MSLPILKAISQAEYQTWFDRHLPQLQHRSPFHHTAWLEAVAQGVQFELRFIGVYEGSDLVAAVPGFLARRGPFWLFGSPLRGTLTSYLGPVGLNLKGHSDGLSDLILACSQFARQQWGAAYTRFTLRDAPPKFQPELGLNWKHQRPGSYRLDLSRGEEALWNGLESDCRRNIRRTERAGVEIVPFDDPGLFYKILGETFRRHGTSSWQSARFYQLLLSGLLPRDLLWAWGVKHEGRIIAAGLFLHDEAGYVLISIGPWIVETSVLGFIASVIAAVVGAYYGHAGEWPFIGAALLFTAATLFYSLKGGLRSSIAILWRRHR